MKELRAGVIGVGAIGKDHINRLIKKISGVTVTAIMDKYVSSAEEIAKTYNLRIEESIDAIVEADDVDIIVVTAASEVHEEAVIKAIKAGKPVFCEKPLATTAEACKRIIEAEMAFGKRLVQVGFMRRFDVGYQKMKTIIDSGKLGDPLIAKCAHRIPQMNNGDFSASMQITDGIIHELDILHWLVNDDYQTVKVVFPKRSKNAIGIQADPQIAIITTKKGLYLEIESYFNCQYAYDICCEIQCEDGNVKLNDPLAVPVRYSGQAINELETDWFKRFVEAYDIEFQAWIDGINKGALQGASSWDGYIAAKAADACIQSQETGKEVEIIIEDMPALYR